MAEALPSLRYRVYAYDSEGGFLGTLQEGDGVPDIPDTEKITFIKYNFITSSGYKTRKDDYSKDGWALKFNYDLSKTEYANKRQFILGNYAYILSKSFTYSGKLPSGGMVALLTYTNRIERKKIWWSMNSYDYSDTDLLFSRMQTQAYNRITIGYFYPMIGIECDGFYTDNQYTAEAQVIFSGPNGAYPPYLDVVAEDVIPSVTDAYPNGNFVDKNDDIRLSWKLTFDDVRYAYFEGYEDYTTGSVYGEITQKSALVRWTEDGGKTIHEIPLNSEEQYLIPAGSVTADNFQWQVKLCTNDGVWSENDDVWYTATTNDVSISSAVAVSPRWIVIENTDENTFVWEHIIDSGSKPTGADLQWSADGESGWTTFMEYRGRDCQCVVPPDSLPSGVIFWRVRTYNASGVSGTWSDGIQVTVHGAPPMPEIIFIGETPLPEIRWGAEGQYVAEIDIDGMRQRVYGSAKTYQWPDILEEGSHHLKLRVQNLYGLWSKWAETSFQTSNQSRTAFLLSGESVDFGVNLMWAETFPQVQVFRDGKRIAKLENQEDFSDWSSVKEAQYRLRGIDENGYYTDSNVVSLAPKLPCAAVGRQGEWIRMKGRFNESPELNRSTQQAVHYQFYAGRSQPVAYPSGRVERNCRFSYSLFPNEKDKLLRLEELSGSHVIYKDRRGNLVEGTLGAVSASEHYYGWDISFEIQEAQEDEE